MRDVYVNLREIACAIQDKGDILKTLAAAYACDAYGVEIDELSAELEEMEEFVDTENGDFLTDIENTLANIDREYGEEDEDDYDYNEDYSDEDDYEEDWDDEDEDEDYDDEDYEDDEDELDEETRRLIEANRRKNEEALGL